MHCIAASGHKGLTEPPMGKKTTNFTALILLAAHDAQTRRGSALPALPVAASVVQTRDPMIRYNKSWWSFRLYFRLYGSAFPRALPFSLSAATIAGILRGFFPDFMDRQFLHPYPFQAFAYICGFIVVFRCALAQTDTCGPSATFTSCPYGQASSMPWLGVPFCARHMVRHQSGACTARAAPSISDLPFATTK